MTAPRRRRAPRVSPEDRESRENLALFMLRHRARTSEVMAATGVSYETAQELRFAAAATATQPDG